MLRNSDEWNERLKDLETIESEYWNCMGIAGEKYADIAAQEGKPIYAYLKEMDEAGLELFSKQYNLEFSWEDKI